ncbi:dTDP-4-dehydrorhamnose 3,5-epimerase [candidate division MSBL1 archaeon SCGC-AAA261G05]|uniref:dTDP-4-dehydrorhamnose 3,5-epimerase n=1 Tax=candidate division MSBL1 archaeon SCGC-AAA261G05 TaxID=1698276 RepID=A0A133V9P1_9EURY|nr:dTDP-4-dehydrorhamnose 3,5-epimerase [candidate division MSBL1 archaeon SCGC-AAA261G05]
MPFEFEETSIQDVILVKPQVFGDDRGYFMETYVGEDFEKAGIKSSFIQDNHSRSKRGVLRGLHFQKEPYAQAKLVRCLRGKIYDVAVDLRESSDTFGEYVSTILSEENKHQLYVPRGFAHGFLVLNDEADVVYKVDNDYSPEHEGGLIWNDPQVNIDWPEENPLLSNKDENWPTLEELKEKGETFS